MVNKRVGGGYFWVISLEEENLQDCSSQWPSELSLINQCAQDPNIDSTQLEALGVEV